MIILSENIVGYADNLCPTGHNRSPQGAREVRARPNANHPMTPGIGASHIHTLTGEAWSITRGGHTVDG